MHLTNHELWALAHGILVGGPLLLAFAGTLVALQGLRADHLTPEGIRQQLARLRLGASVLAGMSWVIVLIGVWVLLPWYREDSPTAPRTVLLSDPSTRQWHEFADVWKTHVAFLSPILATAAAALVFHYGASLARDRRVRRLVLVLFVAAFAVTGVAAILGSLVARAAPLR